MKTNNTPKQSLKDVRSIVFSNRNRITLYGRKVSVSRISTDNYWKRPEFYLSTFDQAFASIYADGNKIMISVSVRNDDLIPSGECRTEIQSNIVGCVQAAIGSAMTDAMLKHQKYS